MGDRPRRAPLPAEARGRTTTPDRERQRGAGEAGRDAEGPRGRTLLALQQAAGNRAVSALLAPGTAPAVQRFLPWPFPAPPASAPAAAPQGRPVGRYARVGQVDPYLSVRSEMDPRQVTVLPDPLVVDTLQFNDRVFVLEEYPQDWAKVRTDNGNIGYTWITKLFVGSPDPRAKLHLIQPGETALGIAQDTYRCGEWGRDGRFFVNVLVSVNQASGDPSKRKGIYKAGGRDDDAVDSWKDTQLLAGYWIWLPGEDFARSLAGTVSSGSITYELWQALKGLVGFVVGVVDGVATALVDLVTGLVDLVSMIVDLVVDLARKGFSAALRELREFFDKLDVKEIASALWQDFESRWNAADAWDKWKFRGTVVGMVLAEIALAALTGGSSVALKVAAKAGRLAKLAAKLTKLDVVVDFAKGVDRAGDATDAGRKARRVLRDERPDLADPTPSPEAPSGRAPEGEAPPSPLEGGMANAFDESGAFRNPTIEQDYRRYLAEGGTASRREWITKTRGGPRARLEEELGPDFPEGGRRSVDVDRPRLRTGADAPRAHVEPRAEGFLSPELRKEQDRILALAETDPTQAGREYQQLVARDIKGGTEVSERFPREGRRPDIGTGKEVTIEGRDGPFGGDKLDQFWLDLRQVGEVDLTVPDISPEALDQLRRLLGQFKEQYPGQRAHVFVRKTGAATPPAWE